METLGRLSRNTVITDVAASLKGGSEGANAGKLRGNRLFYANDYMVRYRSFLLAFPWLMGERFTEAKTMCPP